MHAVFFYMYNKLYFIEIVYEYIIAIHYLNANVYLSAFVQKGDIVMSRQVEPHFKINYPKFPLEQTNFKK